MSILFLVMLSCAGSHGYMKERKACYGGDFSISLKEMGRKTHREWVFVPSNGRTIISPTEEGIPVVMENGTSLDAHYVISSDKFIIREVTKRDEGFIAYKTHLGFTFTVVRLEVEDCSSNVTKEFGSDYYFKCPNYAYSLEFTPLESTHGSQSQVLWNRTNPRVSAAGVRGRMREAWEDKWTMNQITYEYAGYYTFRDENHRFISRNRMEVEEASPYSYTLDQGEDLHFTFGMDPVLFDMTFQANADRSEKVLLMKQGFVNNKLKYEVFQNRFLIAGPTLHITIEDLQPSDSGTFEFREWKGILAFAVFLKVTEIDSPPYVRYIVAAVTILTVVFCCCYVRKRCCKKTTGKNHSVPDTLQDNTQPSTSAHSASHGPTYSYPLFPNEPGSTSQQPLVPRPEVPHVNSSQPQAMNTGSQDNYTDEPPPYDSLFPSDAQPQLDAAQPQLDAAEPQLDAAEPQIEPMGTTSPSAAPLSSNTPSSDVYTSDKLNFL